MPNERYRLLVTEITEYGALRCVAGWDLDRRVMIRPEPRPGDFWPAVMTGSAAPFRVGTVVEFLGQNPEPATLYPHFTEDRVVTGPITSSRITLNATERAECLAATVSASVEDIFGGHAQVTRMTAFVAEGTRCRSLGAMEINATSISIHEDTNWGKKRLRCIIRAGPTFLRPSITSLSLRQAYREGGVEAVQSLLQPASRLHLRIGLARAIPGQPETVLCSGEWNRDRTLGS